MVCVMNDGVDSVMHATPIRRCARRIRVRITLNRRLVAAHYGALPRDAYGPMVAKRECPVVKTIGSLVVWRDNSKERKMAKNNGEIEGGVSVAPFFANLLSSQSDPAQLAGGSGPAPTYHCLDSPCTKKYPSDDDEATTWFSDADY